MTLRPPGLVRDTERFVAGGFAPGAVLLGFSADRWADLLVCQAQQLFFQAMAFGAPLQKAIPRLALVPHDDSPEAVEANQVSQVANPVCRVASATFEEYKLDTQGAFLQHRLLFHLTPSA
jgi:hypothetical protein